MAERFFFTLLA